MPKVTLITGGESHVIDAQEGKTLAEIGAANNVPLFGSCHGTNTCCQCSRRIVAGLEALFRRNGEPYSLPESAAPYVKTCQAVPQGDVTVDCDKRARF